MAAAVFASLGKRPAAALESRTLAPAPPRLLAYLWEWFGGFALGLPSGGMGPAAATWEGLDAWCRRTRVELEPWEAQAMIRLGHIRAVVQSEADAERAKRDRNARTG